MNITRDVTNICSIFRSCKNCGARGNALTRVSSSILRNAVACAGGTFRSSAQVCHRRNQFVAQHAHQNFVMAHPEKLKDISDSVKAKGAAIGREVGTYALFNIITAETDEKAKEIGEDIIQRADMGAIGNIINNAAMDSNEGGTSDHLQEAMKQDLEVGNMAFMGFPTIYGSYETVSAKIDEIAEETGVDGMLFSWADFVGGIRDFGEKIKPRLACL